jgi:hypothetical protein
MFELFAWLRLCDPTQRAVQKYASAVVAFHRKYPDRPLQECVPQLALKLSRKFMPEGTYERDRLEQIVAQDVPCHDPIDFCCRLATLETGIAPDDGEAYLEQAECVAAELARIGFYEHSQWLDSLRASSLAIRRPENSDAPTSSVGSEVLTIPRCPNLGNWIGLTLFTLPALACTKFAHWIVAIVLLLIGMASLSTRVNYWEIDKTQGRLWLKSRNGLSAARQYMGYPAREIVAVDLEMRIDSEGGANYTVRVVFRQGQRIVVSDHRRDADRIAAFLGVEKSVTRK